MVGGTVAAVTVPAETSEQRKSTARKDFAMIVFDIDIGVPC